MPRHDPIPRVLRSMKREPLYLKVVRAVRRKKNGKDDGGLLMPVEPDRPNNLSGGAAAALEFDD